MVSSKIANRYAYSLLENALDKNNLDKVYEDISLLINTFNSSDELKRTVESPVIKPELKKSILDEIFSKHLDKDTINFIHFIVNKKREDVLYAIAERFIELRNEHLGIVELDVKTAYVFSDDQKQVLKKKFEKMLRKKINLNFIIDKNLIGGFVAQVNDTVYDASLKHQLELLKKEFKQGGLSLN